jgi:hypothetical protein
VRQGEDADSDEYQHLILKHGVVGYEERRQFLRDMDEEAAAIGKA